VHFWHHVVLLVCLWMDGMSGGVHNLPQSVTHTQQTPWLAPAQVYYTKLRVNPLWFRTFGNKANTCLMSHLPFFS